VIAGLALPGSGDSGRPKRCLFAVCCPKCHLFSLRLTTLTSPISPSKYHYGLPTAPFLPLCHPHTLPSSPCSAWLCVPPFPLYPNPFRPPLIFPSLDFLVTYPTKGIEVSNGQTFPLTWTKGLLDGIDIFDLELTRMSTDGLILLARDSASLKWLYTPSSRY
jgi:hypothetical protein